MPRRFVIALGTLSLVIPMAVLLYVLFFWPGDPSANQMALNELLVRDAARKLPERERLILDLRYIRGKTQVEVAKQIGISQAQVSRLEKSAVADIRRQIEA